MLTVAQVVIVRDPKRTEAVVQQTEHKLVVKLDLDAAVSVNQNHNTQLQALQCSALLGLESVVPVTANA